MLESKAIAFPTTIAAHPSLVLKFFSVFSRFEYALKRTSEFLMGDDTYAEANWTKYVTSIRGRFAEISDRDFSEAVGYLLAHPPAKQVAMGGALRWKQSEQGPGESKEAYALRLVKTVRNNLFHGGKYPYPEGPVQDVARNRRLLRASVLVLKNCLALSPVVAAHYREAA